MTPKAGDASPASRQFPLNVPVQVEVEGGSKRHTVQVVLASKWSPHLGAAPQDRVSFRVVLLTRPLEAAPPTIQNERVFLCIPSKPLPGPAIAETQAEYRAGASAAPWAWSKAQAEAFSSGTVLGVLASGLNAAALFAGGDAGGFLRRLASLAEAEELRAQVAAMESYLNAALPKQTDEELYLDRLSLQEQLSAGTVFEDSSLWPSVKALFELFKNEYIQAYIRHHRVHRSKVAELQQELKNAEGRAVALRLLDGIAELGDPVGEEALAAYERSVQTVRACGQSENDLANLGADPVCPACRVPLSASPPSAEVQAALVALTEALAQQQRRLSAEAVRQVLAEQHEARIDQFVKVLQVADVGALAQAMDEELADFLRRLLSEVTVELPLASLLREAREQFPTLSEEEISDFLAALEGTLRREIEKARGTHEGKQVRLKIV